MFNTTGVDFTGILGGVWALAAIFYVQRRQRVLKNWYTQTATVAFAVLVSYIWAPFGFPNSDWSRAPLGTDVVRLIPGLQFDPALLDTNWLPIQVAIGASAYFLALIALFGDARRANVTVILIMGVGLELSQALTNLVVGPIPPYRIDIHDVIVRAIGVLAMYVLFSLVAAIYRWKVAPKGSGQGLAAFVDALIRRI
jgi:hypothetical protein